MKHGVESVHKKEDIIMTQLIEALSYPFVQRAIAAGVMISLCAALLGVILVLKRYSLIGHGLGDVGSHPLHWQLLWGCPVMAVSIPIVVVAACLIMFWSQRSKPWRGYSNRHAGNRRFVHWCYYYSDEQRF